MDTVAAEVVSDPSPGLLPLGKGKYSSRENGKTERGGRIQFSVCVSIFCRVPGTRYPLGDIRKPRELAKQDVYTASDDRMVRRCVIRCQDKQCRGSMEKNIQEETVQGLDESGKT